MTELDGELADNYRQIMRERGWSWDDLADDFARQSQQPALDGGAGPRHLERWARQHAVAADLRSTTSPTGRPEDAPPPVDPKREPPKRTAVPPRKPTRQG